MGRGPRIWQKGEGRGGLGWGEGGDGCSPRPAVAAAPTDHSKRTSRSPQLHVLLIMRTKYVLFCAVFYRVILSVCTHTPTACVRPDGPPDGQVFGKPAAAAEEPKKADDGGDKKKPKAEETNPILHRIQEAILQVKTKKGS